MSPRAGALGSRWGLVVTNDLCLASDLLAVKSKWGRKYDIMK